MHILCYQYCTDIDECERGTAECDSVADCTDTDGSYECTCWIGFTGNGFLCTGVYIISGSVCLQMCVSVSTLSIISVNVAWHW